MIPEPGAIAAKAIAALLLLAAVGAGAIPLSSGASSSVTGGIILFSPSLPDHDLAAVPDAQATASAGAAAGIADHFTSRPSLWFLSIEPLPLNKPLAIQEDAGGEEGAKVIDLDKSSRRSEVLTARQDVRKYKTILDISPYPAEYIPGAISISYTDFLSDGVLKTAPEMAEVLGRAGITQDDEVIIYGECQPCGGGPSAATYVYWIMKYLGHSNVSLLDGGIDDWVKAGNPTYSKALHLIPANYTPSVEPGLLASYPFVRSGKAQIIDARSKAEFEAGSIPSSINIPYDRVLDGKRIKDDAALRILFTSLDKDRPVVVYTNTGVKASMIWLALTLLDYDASIYSWKDWQANSK